MQIDIEWVRDVVQTVGESCVYEVAIEDKQCSLRIKRGGVEQPAQKQIAPTQVAPMVQDKKQTIVSPYVGRIQLGQDVLHPLIEVGDIIKEGQVVAFVQAFDTITPVVSGKTGVVQAICVQNHDKVAYGTVIAELTT